MEEKKVAVPPAAETGEEELIEQAKIRREKLAKLQSEGKNPYEQVKYAVDADSETLKNNFEAYEGKTVSLAGRMMSRRIMGKASFSHIADRSGSIQIYVTRQDVGEENYLSYKKDYDIGDIVGFKGFVFKTQTGEITVHVSELVMLSKALLPLPEKYNGLQNQDLKYRLRHLDLIMNREVKDTFVARSRILKEIRAYLDGRGYLEVDTRVLLTLEIGADDYVPKTFSARELLARIRVVLRRMENAGLPEGSDRQDGMLCMHGLCMNPQTLKVTLNNEPLDLTSMEFQLLYHLARGAGRIFSREDLLNLFAEKEWNKFDRCVDVHISSLRKKLGDNSRCPTYLKTVRGLGYMFIKQSDAWP